MKRSSLLWLGLVSSCALPEFGIVSSFDDGSGGVAGHAGTSGGTATGGKNAVAGSAASDPGGGNSDDGGSNTNGGKANAGSSGTAPVAGDGGAPSEPSCTTAPLLAVCDNECVDMTSDSRHCSACNKPCSGADECSKSVCRLCPTGCAVVTANPAAVGDVAWFVIPVNGGASAHANLSVRLYALSAQQISLEVYVVDASGGFFHTSLDLTNRTGWIDFTTEIIPSQQTALTDTKKIELGLQSLKAGASNPSKIYLDSVSVAGGAFPPFNFTGSYAPLAYEGAGADRPSSAPGMLSWQ